MKKVFSLLFLLSACVGIVRAQSYPEPDKRKSYSVLSTAQTLKIAVVQNAVYKVRYEDLVARGLLSQAIASNRVGIYGNSAGMLPFFNITGIYDDLSPLPIQMNDGGDGIFGSGDYFLFYGQAPSRWTYNMESGSFVYTPHYFCDSTFYFVSLNAELEHRINTVSQTSTEGITLTAFPEHIRYENEWVNLCHGGLDWFGEAFSFSGSNLSLNISTPDPVPGRKGLLSVATAAATAGGTATFRIQLNRSSLQLYHSSTNNETAYNAASRQDSVPVESNTSAVNITFTKTGSTGNGYLDYISLVYTRNLRLNGSSIQFRHPEAIQNNVKFSIEAAQRTQIWDVTDVYHISAIASRTNGNRIEFGSDPDNTLHEYIAFDAAACPSPTFCNLVQPQNLHELKNIDYVIVTHPLFAKQAEAIAQLHQERNGYSVGVVTTEQVYNEFSSGAKDPSAIRMFLRHLYVRSEAEFRPRYLLLLGAASYDYKDILGSTTDFVPTLQSSGTNTDGGDDPLEDIFGYLTDDAGVSPHNLQKPKGTLQVAIGRLPVRSVTEAENMVEKIDIYSSPHYISDPSQPNLSGNFGNWRNEVVFITDDGFEKAMEEQVLHNGYIQNNIPYIHLNKLYSDAYERTSSSTSATIPALENSIRNFVESGCLFLGYLGHSGWDAWSDEKIVTNAIIESWKQSYTFPVIFASSCTFSYFDQINQVSGGERAVLRPHGGSIATIATSRKAFSGSIEDIQRCFIERFSDKTSGINTIGDAFLFAKTTANHSDRQKFILLGDPGLKAAIAQNNVQTLHINGKPVSETESDTLRALSPVTIEGRITDMNGDAMNHFNGTLMIKVYDKAVTKQTLGVYDPQTQKYNPRISYTDQNSLIFQGRTEVKDGMFRFSFIVPKDIQYNYGNGRINYYAYSEETDANGSFNGIVVGGINPDAVIDTAAPIVDLYIGKNTFTGGTVGMEPALYAEISDEYGINTTGAGIGHDMTLIIDNDYKNAITVNEYFRYNTGSYKEGTLMYPMELSPGRHTARLKVWNINNISTTKEIVFDVNDSEKLKIFNLKAIPNPARGEYVDFYFNHNSQNGGIAKCTLSIFNLQGMRIAEFNYTMGDLSGYTVGPLRWNLCGNGNKRVQAGMYVGYIKATDAQGNTTHKDIKLIVVN